MKTMQKLCRRFERLFPIYAADLDTLESYRGCYRVCIIDLETEMYYWHMFKSCRDFREWMDGLVPF